MKHGLLSRVLAFSTDEEKTEYESLRADLIREFQPQSWVESMLVDEIAINYWKLPLARRMEEQAISAHSKIARSMCKALILINSEADDEERIPLLNGYEKPLELTNSGWEVRELVIGMEHSKGKIERDRKGTNMSLDGTKLLRPRQGSANDVRHSLHHEEGAQTSGGQTTVRLCSSLETLMRYKASLQRDLFKAIERLDRRRDPDSR